MEQKEYIKTKVSGRIFKTLHFTYHIEYLQDYSPWRAKRIAKLQGHQPWESLRTNRRRSGTEGPQVHSTAPQALQALPLQRPMTRTGGWRSGPGPGRQRRAAQSSCLKVKAIQRTWSVFTQGA